GRALPNKTRSESVSKGFSTVRRSRYESPLVFLNQPSALAPELHNYSLASLIVGSITSDSTVPPSTAEDCTRRRLMTSLNNIFVYFEGFFRTEVAYVPPAPTPPPAIPCDEPTRD